MIGVGNGVNGEWRCVIWNESLRDSDSMQCDEMSSSYFTKKDEVK